MRFAYSHYRIRSSPDSSVVLDIYRPIVPERIVGQSGEDYLRGLLDTGADHCLFPRSLALRIGAELNDNIRWLIGGFAGQTAEAVLGRVRLELADGKTAHHWWAEVGFVNYGEPAKEATVLFGHFGFLQFFNAQFRGSDHFVVLNPNHAFSQVEAKKKRPK